MHGKLTQAVCHEPYRLFFPLGILMGIWGVSHWFWYALGISSSYSGFFHSSIQILVYMSCFIAGFLLTAIPRFTASFPATGSEVAGFLIILLSIAFFLFAANWMAAQILYIGFLLMLVLFVSFRLKYRSKTSLTGSPPRELIWIPVGLLFGVAGMLLLIFGEGRLLPVWAIELGKPIADQGLILCVVMGIGGFLIPRIMGTYKTNDKSRSIKVHLLCALILFMSFWFEAFGAAAVGYALRAAVVTFQFAGAGVLRGFLQPCDFYVRLAWISVWLIALGYWGAALWIKYKTVMLHITFIGGFSLMTFAIATMVVLSHAGEGERLKKPLGILWVVAIGLGISALERALVVLFPERYFHILGGSAVFWVVAATSWLIFMFPAILTVPKEDEFERMHKKAMERKVNT